MPENVSLESTVNQIKAQVVTINDSTLKLYDLVAELTDHQAKQIKNIRRIAMITAIGLVLDLSLTIIGVFLFNTTNTVSHQVSKNQRQITAIQEKTSTEALCPLYDIFLDVYNPKSPQALQNPVEYDREFTVIEQGATALGCKHHTRGRDE